MQSSQKSPGLWDVTTVRDLILIDRERSTAAIAIRWSNLLDSLHLFSPHEKNIVLFVADSHDCDSFGSFIYFL